jgi:hypothetical protein
MQKIGVHLAIGFAANGGAIAVEIALNGHQLDEDARRSIDVALKLLNVIQMRFDEKYTENFVKFEIVGVDGFDVLAAFNTALKAFPKISRGEVQQKIAFAQSLLFALLKGHQIQNQTVGRDVRNILKQLTRVSIGEISLISVGSLLSEAFHVG